MNKAKDLTYKVIDHMKSYDLYEYNDVYDSDEEAFNNLYPLYLTEKGVRKQIEEFTEDLSLLATEKDLKDSEIKITFDSAVNLIKEFNKYYMELSNEKEL